MTFAGKAGDVTLGQIQHVHFGPATMPTNI